MRQRGGHILSATKGFAHLILLLVIGVVLVGGYALYQKGYISLKLNQNTSSISNNVTTWKTYDNNAYGFEFKYPSDYFKYSSQYSDRDLKLVPNDEKKQWEDGTYGLRQNDVWINIGIPENTQNLSIDDYINLPENETFKQADKENITIATKDGYLLTYKTTTKPNETIYSYMGIVKNGSNMYWITLSAFQENILLNNKDLFKKILSTIKLTETQNQSSYNGIADWKTYTDNGLEFSIQYPQEWVYEEFKLNNNNTQIGFGTIGSKQGGYTWGVTVYGNKNLDEAIKEVGKQFKDRKETRQSITITGNEATLLTVTTNEVNNWTSKNIYLQHNGKLYQISNGAIDNSEFVRFYQSFNFTN